MLLNQEILLDNLEPGDIDIHNLKIQVLQIIAENPESSNRKIAEQVNVNYKTAWNILKRNLLYPNHTQGVQTVLRLLYCQWFL